jgi:hypothetical protein
VGEAAVSEKRQLAVLVRPRPGKQVIHLCLNAETLFLTLKPVKARMKDANDVDEQETVRQLVWKRIKS